MSYPIDEIEGIGPANKEKLKAAGIVTTKDLLDKCAAKAGRKTISGSSGIGESNLLKWANMADLMRIKGVGRQFSELLEGAGVDTIKELRTRNAANLAAKMAEVNETKKLCKVCPKQAAIEDWITAAKSMDPMISH